MTYINELGTTGLGGILVKKNDGDHMIFDLSSISSKITRRPTDKVGLFSSERYLNMILIPRTSKSLYIYKLVQD